MSKVIYQIKASDDIQDLTGQGDEVLLDKYGEVKYRFLDGNFLFSYAQSSSLSQKPGDRLLQDAETVPLNPRNDDGV